MKKTLTYKKILFINRFFSSQIDLISISIFNYTQTGHPSSAPASHFTGDVTDVASITAD